jgi:hypothetical protein
MSDRSPQNIQSSIYQLLLNVTIETSRCEYVRR